MTTPPIHISAQSQVRNIIAVEWRIGFIRPKGVVFVVIPDGMDGPALAIAELTAIRFLVETKQVGTGLRHHDVIVSQKAVRDLASKRLKNRSSSPTVATSTFTWILITSQ